MNLLLCSKFVVRVGAEQRGLARNGAIEIASLHGSLVCIDAARLVLLGETKEATAACRTVFQAEATLKGGAVRIGKPVVHVSVQRQVIVGTAVAGFTRRFHGDAIE